MPFRHFLFGAPLTKAEYNLQIEDMDDLIPDTEIKIQIVLNALTKISDKPTGLLTVQALLVAIYTIYHQSLNVLHFLSGVLFLISMLLCASNMNFAWSKIEFKKEKRREYFIETADLVKSRAIRFNISMYLFYTSFVFGSANLLLTLVSK